MDSKPNKKNKRKEGKHKMCNNNNNIRWDMGDINKDNCRII